MVQKEAGERLCAEVGTRQAGAVSVAVNFYASGEILFDVPRESFMPKFGEYFGDFLLRNSHCV